MTVSNDSPVVADSVVCEPTSACASPSWPISTEPAVAPVVVVRASKKTDARAGTVVLWLPTTVPASLRQIAS